MVAHVQSATGGTDNTTFTPSVSFAAPVGIGNTVIAFVGDAQTLIQSVTDDKEMSTRRCLKIPSPTIASLFITASASRTPRKPS